MHLEVSFKNIQPREELRRRSEALFHKLQRFLDPAAEAALVISTEHNAACLELVVSTHGETYKATFEHDELRTALDKVFHTMETQLRRRKERRLDRRRSRGVDEDAHPE